MVKKILLLVALVSVCCNCCKAQTFVNRTYTQGRGAMLFGSVLQADTNFIITGTTYGITGAFKPALNKLSNTGNTVKFKAADDSTNTFYNCYSNALTRGYNGSIVFSGESYDSLSYMMFAITDTLLDSVKIFRYFMPYTYTWYGNVICAAYGDYFVAGIRIDSTPNSDIFLSKLNKDGELQWTRLYNSYERDEAKSIIPLPNGNLLLGCFRTDYGDPVEHANTWLLEVDTAGLIVRQWFDPSDSTYAAEGLLQTPDSGFVYCGQKKVSQTGNTVVCKGAIVKLDKHFNKQWFYLEGDGSIYTNLTDIQSLPDKGFIVCGHKPILDYDTTTLYGWIVRFDSSNYVLWERTYSGINNPNTFNFLYDIDVLANGSIVAVGQCQNLGQIPGQVGWFLKLDSNGCEVENCTVGIETPKSPEGGLIQVWPNPASDKAMVELPDEMIGADLKIFDVAGKQLHGQQATGAKITVDVSAFSKGLYLLTAEMKGRVLRAKLMVE